MKREMYNDLLNWKNKENKKPLIIFGSRQVGKTYLVNEFAKKNYKYIYSINFEFDEGAKDLFSGNLDIKTLLLHLSSYNTTVPIIEGETLLFFDEVQKCPQVLTSLKSFALDGRFDVIASGSMLGIIMHEVSSYPVGYVETLHMRPMNFKEFLWANGYNDQQIDMLKEYYEQGIEVPLGLHNIFNKMFLHYIAIGGMPEAINTYLQTSNIYNVLETQRRIVEDYRYDIVKYASNIVKTKVRECFESIPNQLAKDNKKFQYKVIRNGGTARYFSSSLNWIVDAGLGIKVNRLKTFEIPFRAYKDLNAFKFYFNDTGLLLSLYEQNATYEIISGNLGVFKGGIFENVIAQSLVDNKLDIYYYQKDDQLEIDFVTWIDNKIVPIEVKSGKNVMAKSLKNIIEKEELSYGIVLSMNNINYSNPKVKYIPLYMVMFIK